MFKIAIETDDAAMQGRLLQALKGLDGEAAEAPAPATAPANGAAGGVVTKKVTKKKRGRPPRNPQPEVAEEEVDEQAVLEAAAEIETAVEGEVQTKAEQITRDLMYAQAETYLQTKGVDEFKRLLLDFEATKMSEVGEVNWPALWEKIEAELAG